MHRRGKKHGGRPLPEPELLGKKDKRQGEEEKRERWKRAAVLRVTSSRRVCEGKREHIALPE